MMGDFIAAKLFQLLGFLFLWWVVLGLLDLLVASGFFILLFSVVVAFLFILVLAYMLMFD